MWRSLQRHRMGTAISFQTTFWPCEFWTNPSKENWNCSATSMEWATDPLHWTILFWLGPTTSLILPPPTPYATQLSIELPHSGNCLSPMKGGWMPLWLSRHVVWWIPKKGFEHHQILISVPLLPSCFLQTENRRDIIFATLGLFYFPMWNVARSSKKERSDDVNREESLFSPYF